MADLSDVSNALVSIVAQVLYPNGTGQASVTGIPTLVYPGWPQSSQLDADLATIAAGTGRLHVTVFPTATEQNVTRYFPDWQSKTQTVATLSLAISSQTITVGGTVSTPQNVALLVNDLAYTYAVQSSDTLTSIATALAALIPGASNTGAVITIPDGQPIRAARAGGSGVLQRETKRQNRVMQITVWANSPDNRTATAAAIDSALSGMERIALPDQTLARLIYKAAHENDGMQQSNLYRRDLLYSVEYATTQTAGATEVVVAQENLDVGMTGATVYPTTATVYQ